MQERNPTQTELKSTQNCQPSIVDQNAPDLSHLGIIIAARSIQRTQLIGAVVSDAPKLKFACYVVWFSIATNFTIAQ